MGQSIYYHNVSKGQYNINDFSDAVEMSDKNDIILFSERGNALIFNIRLSIHDEPDEYNYIRKRFYSYFKEFHEKEFNCRHRKI